MSTAVPPPDDGRPVHQRTGATSQRRSRPHPARTARRITGAASVAGTMLLAGYLAVDAGQSGDSTDVVATADTVVVGTDTVTATTSTATESTTDASSTVTSSTATSAATAAETEADSGSATSSSSADATAAVAAAPAARPDTSSGGS